MAMYGFDEHQQHPMSAYGGADHLHPDNAHLLYNSITNMVDNPSAHVQQIMMSGGGENNKRKEESYSETYSGPANHFGSSVFDCDDEESMFGKHQNQLQQ